MNIHITINGCPIVKKGTSKTSLFTKDKFNRKIPRDTPVHYYTQVYKDWAKNAIQTLMVFKTKHREIQFPIADKINLKCLFYMPDNRRVDLSALYEGVQDCLAGNEKWANIDPNLFQIIFDDSVRYIGSHDGSRVLMDMINPRIEIFITDYKM